MIKDEEKKSDIIENNMIPKDGFLCQIDQNPCIKKLILIRFTNHDDSTILQLNVVCVNKIN